MGRTDREIAEIYQRHKNMIYRVCFAYLKNPGDTEDALQETFCRLVQAEVAFADEEHEKAWLITVATNLCKNTLRHWWRRTVNLERQNLGGNTEPQIDSTLAAVLNLPAKYKTVVYLYYYEGYNSTEIAKMLGKPQSTVRNYLSEARKTLREKLGGEFS